MKAENTTTLTGNTDIAGIEEKLKEDCKILPELESEDYAHKLEQIYLMHVDGRTDEFVRHFLKDDIGADTATMDAVRLAAKLCGEVFAEENLLFRSFTLEELTGKISDYLTEKRYETLPDIRRKLDEAEALEKMLSSMKEFLEGLKKEPVKEAEKDNPSEELFKIQLESMKQQYEGSMKALRADVKARGDELQKARDSLSGKEEECMKLKTEIIMLEKSLKEKEETIKSQQAALEAMARINSAPRKKRSFFERHRRGNTDEEVHNLVENEIASAKYSDEQMDILIEALGEGFCEKDLRLLCKPEMGVNHMKKLKILIEKRRENEDGR